ncbi:hypothetical protein [Clostridium botulinum]|uniref:hypothetical protein n=1 Tax=Clostridium botulinum TaxID=1491 RepID=UPI001C9ACC4F|nr:hypothetical protein [Clostridium botulinum]MBY6810794.1 hypothetical protein [Clostridium botulinum]MBY6824211.1 hypothetical protein [Clostridium botulinum]MBY6834665.1 hypothetical protein [Clostridium botulinum]MBY6973377.1 hypothetical protein [Clostridium botulinum]MCS6104393.1 hypothetical protein [Clostridium botulinum]
MDFITSTIISGVVYDLIKKGVELKFKDVFGEFYNMNLDKGICEEFVEEINKIGDKESKIKYCKRLLNEENKYTIMFEENSYKTNFGKRFDYIINLINDSGYFGEKVNIEKLGKMLGFSSVNDLKIYYTSTEEPSYEFIENIAIKLGVNVEWMQYGQKEPFESTLPYIHRADQILMQKDFDNIEEFIFVMDDGTHRRNLGVILKFNKLRYSYYPYTFTFHAEGGSDGQSELFSVYKFLKELNKKRKMPDGIYIVNEKQFLELFKGKTYAESIRKYNKQYCTYLLDDFISLYSSQEDKEKYLKWYGKVFVDCQEIIKYKLSN